MLQFWLLHVRALHARVVESSSQTQHLQPATLKPQQPSTPLLQACYRTSTLGMHAKFPQKAEQA
jgi:hypothetical protein